MENHLTPSSDTTAWQHGTPVVLNKALMGFHRQLGILLPHVKNVTSNLAVSLC